MPITESGMVKKSKKNIAFIELKYKPECEGCKACSFNKRKSIIVPALKEAECAAGDEVTVVMPEKHIGFAPLFLFAIPLLLLISGAAAGTNLGPLWQGILCAAGLTAGLAVAFAADKLYRRSKKFMPIIKGVIKCDVKVSAGQPAAVLETGEELITDKTETGENL